MSKAWKKETSAPQRKDQRRRSTRNNKVGTQAASRVIIQKPVTFPYKDSKRVPWNYDCNVMNSIGTSEEGQDIGFYMRSGRCYDPASTKEKTSRLELLVNKPVTENEAEEFLKFLKHSEYSVVE
ncbi:hypothetical protein EPI10_002115 [Gossypium australe]|uniref:Uncharacterized protein n=1 Tax=Gossypium australe TaxID=47621 RepID=A0A5B6VD31_9ROSI|nr:hypothetical protein EPI10_002115 [Gossypium australe]